MASSSKYRLQLLTILARKAKENFEAFIPTRRFGRLKKSIRFIVTGDGITIYSTYYWARFVNDGRRSVKAKPGKYLVFFSDPEKDPRIASDYPRKIKDRKVLNLSKEEFRRLRSAGELTVTKQVDSAAGLNFLQQGIQKTRQEAKGVFRDIIRGETSRLIRRGANKITVRFGG